MNVDEVIKAIKETDLSHLTRTTYDYSMTEGIRHSIIREITKRFGDEKHKYMDNSRGPHEQKSISRRTDSD